MNARTFGTDDQRDVFADKYGSADYATVGHKIQDAQREHNARPVGSAAPVSPVFIDQASDKAINYLVSLWMERSNKATEDQVRAWAKSVDRRVVSEKIDWLKTQPKLQAARSNDGSLERHNVPAGR